MIPEEKRAAATRGLREAFGVAEFEDIRMTTSVPGANPVFRVVVRGTPYLLRINMRAGDLDRHYACMKAAADAGLAPRVWYASAPDRISITNFVESAPFPAADALIRIPATLRALHALPGFAGAPNHLNTTCMFLIHQGPARDAFLQRFRSSNILPQGDCEELFARYAEMAAAYRYHDSEMVSSHNDLFKPDNMLFDGRRLWLVDWEAAFLNDRYADLAVVANMIVTNDAEESAFLQEYFGAPPNPYQLARFFLMRQLAHIFYAMGFLSIGSMGGPVDWSESVPEYWEFQRRFWLREFELCDNHTKIAYARVHLEELLRNARLARYREALGIVTDRHATA